MSKKNKAIEKKNNTNNDSTTDSKERKTLNISLQKRNLDLLNSIIDNWERNGLVVSNEACNCILFNYSFENNPFLQTLLSRINLIKNNIDSKDLYGCSYNDALNIALKNVLEIKINPTELVRLLEDDLYFKNTKEVNTTNIDNTKDNIRDNKQTYDYNTSNNNFNINNDYNNCIDKNQNNNTANKTNINEKDMVNTNDNKSKITREVSSNQNNSLNKAIEDELATEKYTNEKFDKESKTLVWNIPKPLYDNLNSDLNEKLNAFSYNI